MKIDTETIDKNIEPIITMILVIIAIPFIASIILGIGATIFMCIEDKELRKRPIFLFFVTTGIILMIILAKIK